jgi:hypothetical protein
MKHPVVDNQRRAVRAGDLTDGGVDMLVRYFRVDPDQRFTEATQQNDLPVVGPLRCLTVRAI